MSIAFTFEDTLRCHDVAVFNWLMGLTVNYDNIAGTPRNGESILATQASPERAFAAIPSLLVSRGWIDGATAADMLANAENNFDTLPLPLCTIVRGEPTVDYEQSGPPKAYTNRFFDTVTQKWIKHRWPGSYRCDYTLTFWMRKRYTEAHIREWVMSQLGQVGSAASELFIPVVHETPWGTIPQSFKLVGSTDLSDLEGEGQRYIRFEMTFSLRMMLMYKAIIPPANEGWAITSVQTQVGLLPPGKLPNEDIPLGPLTGGFQQTENLFAYILPPNYFPVYWPKTGGATVAVSPIGPEGVPDGLRLTVQDPADSVELAERPIALDGQQQAVIQVSLAYVSDAPVMLEVTERDPNTDIVTAIHTLALPQTAGRWKRVSFFTLADLPIFAVSFVGAGTKATVHVAEIDLRHIFTQPFVVFTEQSVVGPDMEYRWTGLPNIPLLVRASLGSTPGPVPFVIADDILAPTVSDTVSIDSTENVGFAYLIQPKAGSLSLRVPGLVALVSVALHRYGGHYHQNEA